MRIASRLLSVTMVMAWALCLASCSGAEETKAGGGAAVDAVKPGAEQKTEAADTEKAPEAPDMKKVSYCIGANIGEGLGRAMKQADVKVDVEELITGLKTAIAGDKTRFTEEEMQAIMTAFQKAMFVQQMAKAQKDAEDNKAKGAAYLAANKAKEGVTTTASGLEYRVITKGDAAGKQPKATDTVTVHYKGRFIDGTEFDSSYKRGEPATFEVGGVIPGWIEALQLMREGDVFELTVPSDLAYGERGREGIPPNSVLVFEVELKKVGVEEPKAPEVTTPAPETPKPDAPKTPDAPK